MKACSTFCFLSSLLIYSQASFAQWNKTNGPEGIFVTSFFEDGNLLLCGTEAQGVFRSTDNGNTWTASNTGLENRWVDCFLKDGNTIYAGIFGEGVFKSNNNGLTWQPANNGIQTQAVYSLVKAGIYLMAGTVGNGVFRSLDNGNTWQDANGGALGSSFIKAMVYCAPRLMVEADNYIFFTYNFGLTWDVDQGNTAFYVIDNFFQKGDTVFANAFSNIFKTFDGGLNWIGPISVDQSVVGFDMRHDTIFAGTAHGIYYTHNWGNSWQFINPSNLRTGAADFIISSGEFLLGREELGVTISHNNGNSWSEIPLSQFSRASTIDNALISSNGVLYCGTHGNGVFKSDNSGNTWTKIGASDPFAMLSNEIIFSILKIEPNIILAGGCGHGLFRSTDNGVTWSLITAGLPIESMDDFTCVKTLIQCGANILAALTEGVYYSTNNGLTWNATNLTTGVLTASGFAVAGNIACVGIAGYPLQSGIYRSTNSGVNWSLAATIPDVESMAAGSNQSMYAGNLFDSYVSDDNGISWSGISVGGAFAIHAWDQYAFIGNNLGVFYTEDHGENWELAIEGMDPYPNNAVQGLTHDDEYMYAGMYRDAVWRRPLSDFGFLPACSAIVTTNANSDPGSLRDVIGCSLDNAKITFAPGLIGQTITLTSGEILLDKNIEISGPGMLNLTISGNNASRIFHVPNSNVVEISGLSLKNGSAVSNGGAIWVQGELLLRNVLFQNNKENGVFRAMSIAPPAHVRMEGSVEVRN